MTSSVNFLKSESCLSVPLTKPSLTQTTISKARTDIRKSNESIPFILFSSMSTRLSEAIKSTKSSCTVVYSSRRVCARSRVQIYTRRVIPSRRFLAGVDAQVPSLKNSVAWFSRAVRIAVATVFLSYSGVSIRLQQSRSLDSNRGIDRSKGPK
jgi:hypothetical protein